MKKILFNLVTYGVSAGILAYLVVDAQRSGLFDQLANQPKDWRLLSLAAALGFSAVFLTIVRWYYLVRALDIPFRFRDAVRLGFLGYLFNFVSLGSVGGDLFKAVFIAREKPGRRTEAVASVAVDRVVGLFALFVLATAGILATRQYAAAQEEIRFICKATLIFTAIGTAVSCVMLMPGFTTGPVSEMLAALPKIGPTVGRLIDAMRMYRKRLGVLALAVAMSIGVQTLFVFCVYLTAHGLPGEVPSLSAHFVIVPLAFVTGLLPLPGNGLGAFEAALDFLYRYMPGAAKTVAGQGLLVAFGYRAITIVIAMVGMVIYWFSRREVVEAMHTAEHLNDAQKPTQREMAPSSAAPARTAASAE